MLRIGYFIVFSSLFLRPVAYGASLPIEEFLQQVSSNNPAVRAALVAQSAALTQAKDADIQFLPQIDLEAKEVYSQQATYFASFYGLPNETQTYLAGIREKTNFGLSGEIAYNLTHYDMQNASFVPPPHDYFFSEPQIQLTQNLWKNGFGAKDRADNRAQVAAAQSDYYDNLAKYRATLMDARNTYLQLYYSRKKTAALKESLVLAAQLRSWSKSRAANELGDRSDFLQTEAAYKLRELELVANENDLKTAARAFNSLRGLDSDEVHEELSQVKDLADARSHQLQIEKYSSINTAAAAKKLEAVKAKNESSAEDAKPQLDIMASYAYSYVDPDLQTAVNFGYHPVQMYSIVFIAPIFFTKAERVTDSFVHEAEAAEHNLRRAKQEEQRDLQTLVSKIQNSAERLDLAQKLEAAQKEKFDTERSRHRRGRTSLFQVLTFEQDFVSAQMNRIATELEYHTNLNQLGLYEVNR